MIGPLRLMLAACAAVILLHVAGSFYPVHALWGVHIFGFASPLLGAVALLSALAMMVPAVREAAAAGFDAAVRRMSRIPAIVAAGLLVGLLVALGTVFAAELHLLGDSAILIRSIPKKDWGDEVILSFRNQPLLNVVYRWAMNLDPAGQTTNPREVYSIINFIAGGLMVLVVSWFVRKLPRPPAERVLLGLFVFSAAGTQFFFGYVENYVLQYVATIAYAVTGWLALERRIHVAVPLALLALLPGLNLGTFIFLPSGLFLLVAYYRIRWTAALGITGGLALLGVAVMAASGFGLSWFSEKFTGKVVDLLPLVPTSDGNFPYTMFSLWHLLAWTNAHLLVVPFGLLIPAALLPGYTLREIRENRTLVFLLVLSACGLLFTWIINSALGMVRDWDMLSSFFIPLAVLDVYLLAKAPRLEPRRGILLAVTLITLLHTAGFIAVNADGERHLARMRALNNRDMFSKAAQMRYDEALANYFFGEARYAEARIYYEDYMKIDSMNTRIIGNISDVYRKLGESEKYFEQLQRGVRLGSPNPGVYANLGVEFSSRGDTASAFHWNERAVALDSLHPSGNANLGILYMGRKEYERANLHFARAVAAGMREAKLFLFAAESAALSERYELALRYYDAYVERAPEDLRARDQRDRLRALVTKRSSS